MRDTYVNAIDSRQDGRQGSEGKSKIETFLSSLHFQASSFRSFILLPIAFPLSSRPFSLSLL